MEQSSNQLAFPLFIFDVHDSGLDVFSNLKDPQAYYEAYDVLDGEYFGFDAQGRPLRFFVLEHARVGIEPADQPLQPEALEQSLRAYLKVVDARAGDPECDLSCLMAMAAERYSFVYDPHFIFHFFRDGFRELFAFIRKRLSKNTRKPFICLAALTALLLSCGLSLADSLEFELKSDMLQSARILKTQRGYEALFRLTEPYRSDFAKLTRENIGRHLVILFKGRALASTNIQDEILGGSIGGGPYKTRQEAEAFIREVMPGIGEMPVR